jgi:diacylglycerol kinase family enzyme
MVVFGLIPSIAAAREQVRGRHEFGAAIGFFRYFVRRVTRGRRMAVAITSRDTTDRIERVHAFAVANNAYDEAFGQVFSRKQLDAGRLTLYTMRHLTLADVLRLSAEMLAGVWKQDEAISIESVRAVTLQSKRPKLSVMIDGEVVVMDTPLEFRIRPLALWVLAPVPHQAVAAAVASVSG